MNLYIFEVLQTKWTKVNLIVHFFFITSLIIYIFYLCNCNMFDFINYLYILCSSSPVAVLLLSVVVVVVSMFQSDPIWHKPATIWLNLAQSDSIWLNLTQSGANLPQSDPNWHSHRLQLLTHFNSRSFRSPAFHKYTTFSAKAEDVNKRSLAAFRSLIFNEALLELVVLTCRMQSK